VPPKGIRSLLKSEVSFTSTAPNFSFSTAKRAASISCVKMPANSNRAFTIYGKLRSKLEHNDRRLGAEIAE
jgi:hypothetical protein